MARTVADVALLDAAITGGAPAAPVSLAGCASASRASFWAGLESQVERGR